MSHLMNNKPFDKPFNKPFNNELINKFPPKYPNFPTPIPQYPKSWLIFDVEFYLLGDF